jgi:hypothetical protein
VSRGESGVVAQLRALRKELADRQERIREDLAAVANDPRRLPAVKRRSLFDQGLALRVLDDLEAQILAGATDDAAGTVGQVIGLLKQIQATALPGNATPVHGSAVSGPPTPTPALRGGTRR